MNDTMDSFQLFENWLEDNNLKEYETSLLLDLNCNSVEQIALLSFSQIKNVIPNREHLQAFQAAQVQLKKELFKHGKSGSSVSMSVPSRTNVNMEEQIRPVTTYQIASPLPPRMKVERKQSLDGHRGYLFKRGGANNQHNWKKRWVILTKDALSYFVNYNDKVPLRRIKIRDCLTVTISKSDERNKFVFTLLTNADRSYIFASCYADEAAVWVSAIQIAISRYVPTAMDRKVGGDMNSPWKMSLLQKQGHNVQKTYVERFVAIKEDKLAYYKTALDFEEAKPINVLSLANVTVNALVGKKFSIAAQNKTYFFACPSTQSCNSWVNTIRQGILFSINQSKSLHTSQDSLDISAFESLRRSLGQDFKCSDCDATEPEMASIPFGILLCLDCSFAHRLRSAKIVSLKLDKLSNYQINILRELSLYSDGELFPTFLTKPRSIDSRFIKQQYIDVKYGNVNQEDSEDGEIKEKEDPLKLALELYENVKTDDLIQTIHYLHKKNVPVDFQNQEEDNRSLLHAAAFYNQPNQVELLLQNGAKTDALDVDFKLPADYARALDFKESLSVLNREGTDFRNTTGLELRLKMSGFLFKMGGQTSVRGYQKRWFILQDGVLSYYRSEKDFIAKGTINVHDMLSVQETPQIELDKHCFEVKTRYYRTFNFYALTGDEAMNWIRALTGAIKEVPQELREATITAPIDKQGWMNKKLVQNQSWKRRFFELRGRDLFYKLDEDQNVATGSFNLRQLQKVCLDAGDENDLYCFQIVLANQTLILKADNEQSMEEWFTLFQGLLYFSLPLDYICEREDMVVPKLILDCVQFIEKNEGTNTMGLYRLSGTNHTINTLKQMYDSGAEVDLFQTASIHDVASLLKLYLRELPGGLISGAVAQNLQRAATSQDKDQRMSKYREQIRKLPVENYSTLLFLVQHFQRIYKNNNINKMTASNIAIIFGPTLFEQTNSSMLDLGGQCRTVEDFISYKFLIFEKLLHLDPKYDFDKLSAERKSSEAKRLSGLIKNSPKMESNFAITFFGKTTPVKICETATADDVCSWVLDNQDQKYGSMNGYCLAEIFMVETATMERIYHPKELVHCGPKGWEKDPKRQLSVKLSALNNVTIQDFSSFSGFVTKEGGKIKSWKRRFFVCDSTNINYYKDLSAKGTPLGTFSFQGLFAYRVIDYRRATSPFCIGLQSDADIMRFICTDTENDMNNWITVINYHRMRLNSKISLIP